MTLNVGKGDAGKLFGDKRIRQALEASIDRAAINQVVFNGEFTPGNQWVSPQNSYYQTKFPVPAATSPRRRADRRIGREDADPGRFHGAEQSRDAAGGRSHPGDGGGSRLRHEDPRHGIRDLADRSRERPLPGLSHRLVSRTDPDGNIYSFAKTGQALNYSGYSDPVVDAALDEARTKTSAAERKATYEKATAKLLEDGGIVYLYHRLVIIAHTTRLQGYSQMPDGLVRVKGLKLN